MANNVKIPESYLEQIKKDTEEAVERGWDAAASDWRIMALQVLCRVCLTTRSFTVDNFRAEIKASEFKTHDNRAMGGLMQSAKRWGWIAPSGESIPSKVGHKVPIQVWKSVIYQEPSAREMEAIRQSSLFT